LVACPFEKQSTGQGQQYETERVTAIESPEMGRVFPKSREGQWSQNAIFLTLSCACDRDKCLCTSSCDLVPAAKIVTPGRRALSPTASYGRPGRRTAGGSRLGTLERGIAALGGAREPITD